MTDWEEKKQWDWEREKQVKWDGNHELFLRQCSRDCFQKEVELMGIERHWYVVYDVETWRFLKNLTDPVHYNEGGWTQIE